MDLNARELVIIEDALRNYNEEARSFILKHDGDGLLQTEVREKIMKLHSEIVALLEKIRAEKEFGHLNIDVKSVLEHGITCSDGAVTDAAFRGGAPK